MKQMADINGRWLILAVENFQSQFIIVNTYGFNSKQQNKQLFFTLEEKIKQMLLSFPSAKILWGGDFNRVVNDSMDKWPPRSQISTELNHICNRMGIIDIWRCKHLDKIRSTLIGSFEQERRPIRVYMYVGICSVFWVWFLYAMGRATPHFFLC